MSEELFNTAETPFNLAGELIDNSMTREGELRLCAQLEAEAKKAQQTFEYEGPFPRKRHSHRCQKCGGNSVACYKANCRKLQRVQSCQWCRL